jgi:hypothetical protein
MVWLTINIPKNIVVFPIIMENAVLHEQPKVTLNFEYVTCIFVKVCELDFEQSSKV